MTILIFGLFTAFCFWVIFLNGAEVMEGWSSLFIFEWFASILTAHELKFYVGISWFASLALLLFKCFGGHELAV